MAYLIPTSSASTLYLFNVRSQNSPAALSVSQATHNPTSRSGWSVCESLKNWISKSTMSDFQKPQACIFQLSSLPTKYCFHPVMLALKNKNACEYSKDLWLSTKALLVILWFYPQRNYMNCIWTFGYVIC